MNLLLTLLPLVPNPPYVQEVVDRWEEMDIDVKVVTHACGQVNAYYTPGDNLVELCTETVALGPNVARAILNHELAHAFMDQHAVSTDDGEFAADELSYFFLTGDEVTAIAGFHLDLAAKYPGAQGDHPRFLERAGMFIMLDEGFMGADPMSAIYFRSAFDKWSTIVADYPNVER